MLVVFLVATSASIFIEGNIGACYAEENGSKSGELTTDGMYAAVTEDGITLMMRRYRPTPDAVFNEGAQPILLMPGILCNMYEFLPHTPASREKAYSDIKLPDPIADWAYGDPYIEEDPMLYYSIAHYLWLKGYDPWFGNYRGTGYKEFKSETGPWSTTLDTWALYDTPAFIEKVTEVTGKAPIIGGHSTGGLVSYIYLQGACFGEGENPHVQSDPSLAAERNKAIKGFIALDPAGVPPLPKWLDLRPLWALVGEPLYLPLGLYWNEAVNALKPAALDDDVVLTLEMVIDKMRILDNLFGKYIDLFGYLAMVNSNNLDPHVADFSFRYAFPDSTFIRGLGQYFDFGMNNTIREFWKNGGRKMYPIIGPKPKPDDGYYYCTENMDKVAVPTIAILSESDSLVNAENIIQDLMEAKTPNENDEYYIIEGTAHIDVPMGIKGPIEIFPLIGAWLDKIQ